MKNPDQPAGHAHGAGTVTMSHGHNKPGKRAPLTGGHWAFIRGHSVYIRDKQAVAGGVAGVTHHPDTLRPLHPPDHDHAALERGVADAFRGEVARVNAKRAANRAGRHPNAPPRPLKPIDPPQAWHAEVSGPKSKADAKHLADATARGHVAVAIEPKPKHETIDRPEAFRRDVLDRIHPDADRPGATHHVLDDTHIASVVPAPRPGVPDRHLSVDSAGDVAAHRTRAGADNRAGRLVRQATREATGWPLGNRLSVPRMSEFDPADYIKSGHKERVVVRVIRPGGHATMSDDRHAPESGIATFKGKGGKKKLTGGHWVTIHGHPAYVAGGKVLAGGIPGQTHDAKSRKPSGNTVPIAKEYAHLARAHVVGKIKAGRAAERIRGNAPGRDTTGLDHRAMAGGVESYARERSVAGKPLDFRYSHGAPTSPADRAHLARADEAGGVAVKSTVRPRLETKTGREFVNYHFAGAHGAPISRAAHRPNESGRYESHKGVGAHAEITEHRTSRSARKAARKHAADAIDEATTTRRYVVRNPNGRDVAWQTGSDDPDDSTHIRVIHRGRGSHATFSGGTGDGWLGRIAALFNCGTGKGGFKSGNRCGHAGTRNARVESLRSAHTAARAEVSRLAKAHKSAGRKAAKAGREAPAPKELHAAIKKAAAAHRDYHAARDEHRAVKRSERNAKARETRAVKSGKASPIGAKPKPPVGGQGAKSRTDKGPDADRLGVAAARHRRIGGSLLKRAGQVRQQADRAAGGGGVPHVAPPGVGPRGRGLGGAPVGVGSVRAQPAAAHELGMHAGKLEARARVHGRRAAKLELEAAKVRQARDTGASKPGSIRFREATPHGGVIEHEFRVEEVKKLEPNDPTEWTIADYYHSAVDGSLKRSERGGIWNTKGLAMSNLEHHFGQYARSRKVERIH
jgi:hypothetical protein